MRKHARSENRRYCDPLVLTYQAERMPEQIRLKVGGVTPQQIAVYDEFARFIPGFVHSKQDGGQPAVPNSNLANRPQVCILCAENYFCSTREEGFD